MITTSFTKILKKLVSTRNSKIIHPNSKLETQIKPGKFHRTKKAWNKTKETPPSSKFFKKKEDFIKRITANEPMKSY